MPEREGLTRKAEILGEVKRLRGPRGRAEGGAATPITCCGELTCPARSPLTGRTHLPPRERIPRRRSGANKVALPGDDTCQSKDPIEFALPGPAGLSAF